MDDAARLFGQGRTDGRGVRRRRQGRGREGRTGAVAADEGTGLLQVSLPQKTYTIADIAIYPWFSNMYIYGPTDNESCFFLALKDYTHANEWMDRMKLRKAVMRGLHVNKANMVERYAPADFQPEEH